MRIDFHIKRPTMDARIKSGHDRMVAPGATYIPSLPGLTRQSVGQYSRNGP